MAAATAAPLWASLGPDNHLQNNSETSEDNI
jgi:hypothetical protein